MSALEGKTDFPVTDPDIETSRLGAKRSGMVGERPSDAVALTLLIELAGLVLS